MEKAKKTAILGFSSAVRGEDRIDPDRYRCSCQLRYLPRNTIQGDINLRLFAAKVHGTIFANKIVGIPVNSDGLSLLTRET